MNNMVKAVLIGVAAVSVCVAQGSTKHKSITVTDIDGNVYHTVKIGNQVWTVENLKTTKYNDGTPIPLWGTLTTVFLKDNESIPIHDNVPEFPEPTSGEPTYCWFDNDIGNKEKYGALYNWYAVNTGKLAPTGWHVPTDAEWTILEKYLVANGYNWDGTTDMTTYNKIAKSLAAKTDWAASTNTGAIGNDLTKKNNRSGFSALPGGYRNDVGDFYPPSNSGTWWSATEKGATSAYYRNLHSGYDNLNRGDINKSCGFSVRLVRD